VEVGTKTTDASMDEWLQVSGLCFNMALIVHKLLSCCWEGLVAGLFFFFFFILCVCVCVSGWG
jgi:hypothetical protein